MHTAIQTIKRGEIYYIHSFATTGSEQRSGRPAIIVSNNDNNAHSNTFEICYCTLQEKTPLPTHVTIDKGVCKDSTILCEQVTTVSIDKLGDYKGRLPDDVLDKVDQAIAISLGIDYLITENPNRVRDIVHDTLGNSSKLQEELEQTKKELKHWREECSAFEEGCKERDMYKRMYEDILDRVMKRG